MSGRAGTSPHRTGSRGGSGRGRRDRPAAPGGSLRKRHLLPDGAVAGTRHVSPRGCGPCRASPRWLTRVLGRSAAGGAPAGTPGCGCTECQGFRLPGPAGTRDDVCRGRRAAPSFLPRGRGCGQKRQPRRLGSVSRPLPQLLVGAGHKDVHRHVSGAGVRVQVCLGACKCVCKRVSGAGVRAQACMFGA